MSAQNSIKQSASKIFKFIFNLFKNIYRFPGHVFYTIKRIGSFPAAIKKTIKIYQKEGFLGVRDRFKKIVQIRKKQSYQLWIHYFDTLTPETRANMKSHIKKFSAKPLISIVMPTYNTKPQWLIEVIESVKNQIYTHWELCIADDASTDPEVRSILERYAKEDSRIKVTFRPKNGHISESSNTAIKLATGKWIALLDHDDLLSENALFWVVNAINQKPDVKLIYSDEDKIDEMGIRQDPYFKCDWNVDLFYSHNLITHLGVYDAKIIKKIGGFRSAFNGAQDYDLALRFIEHIKPNQIHHIPRVLYHWRMHSLSTAKNADNKPYAMLAGERALNEHLKKHNKNAKAELIGIGYRARYKLPAKPPLVSLIIPTRNGLKVLKTCVNSILEKTTYPNYEIIIVDNGSDDPATLEFLNSLRRDKKARIIRDDGPFNYSVLNNKAAKAAKGKVLGLINNDLEVITPDWLSEMVSHALRPGIGAVGAKLIYPNNTIQHAGVITGIGGVAGHSHRHLRRNDYGYAGRAVLINNFSAVTAACLVVRKSVYDEVKGLDEKNLKVALNDVDFCLKIQKKGYRNLFTPYAELYHYESATRGHEDNPEKLARFEKERQFMKDTWGDQLINDPAYSPNLTLTHENYDLAWPPRIKPI